MISMERRQKTFLALTFFLVVSVPLSKVYIEPVYTDLPVAGDVQAQGASWKASLAERNLLVEANDYSPPGANPKHDPISPPSST